MSENPNSGGRKRQNFRQSHAGAKPGFTQRLSFGKAAIAFLSASSSFSLSASRLACWLSARDAFGMRGDAVLIEQPFQRNLRSAGIVLAADRGKRRVGSGKTLGQR